MLLRVYWSRSATLPHRGFGTPFDEVFHGWVQAGKGLPSIAVNHTIPHHRVSGQPMFCSTIVSSTTHNLLAVNYSQNEHHTNYVTIDLDFHL